MRRLLVLITVLLLVLSMGGAAAGPPTGEAAKKVKVLLGFKGQPGPAEQALVHGVGGDIKYTYHLVPAIAATVPETAIEALQRSPTVIRVEPDIKAHAVDQELENAWGVKHIGSGDAHTAGITGTGVSLAVIDSGVDYEHPDLDGVYADGYDFVESDDTPMDVYGHGTHVAGTACAEDDGNGTSAPLGVVGVAPGCDLYSLRVLDDDGYGDASDIIAAMEWATDGGLQVANLSLGWDRDPGSIVKTAFDNAWDDGMVIVAAAGNSGNSPGRGNNVIYPAKYDSVIAVAATDENDERASFSSTGEEVELAAPGVSVFSTWNDGTSHYDPQPVCGNDDNGDYGCYKYASGTSMASPHVAGVAALAWSANTGLTNVDVRTILQESAEDLGLEWNHQGYGLVRADEAVAAAETLDPQKYDLSVSSTEGGLVTDPGEGNFTYNEGTVVDLNAEADSGHVFAEWTGDAGNIADVNAAETTITMEGDYTITANFEEVEVELAPDVSSVEPDSASRRERLTVAISGANFQDGATVDFGERVIVQEVTFVSDSQLEVRIRVHNLAEPGDRDVTVTNPDGESAVLKDGFTVTY